MRVLSFLTVTVLGIAAYYLIPTRLGPLAPLVALAALFWIYRTMRRRFDGNDEAGSRRVFPPEMVWTAFAACCLVGGELGGLLAYNPDAYMRPAPTGPAWGLIALGTGAGTIVGGFVVSLLQLANRGGRRRAGSS